MKFSTKLTAAALLAVGTMVTVPATAAPLSAPLGLSNTATTSPVQTVQWRRGGYGYRGGYYRRGWGPGIGIGAGLAAGAIIGGALAAPYYAPGYYGPGYAYGPGPAYAPGYVRGAPQGPGQDEVAYCQQQYRSYRPETGTYRGFDGQDHPCP